MRALSARMLDQNPALLAPVGGTDDSAAVSCLLGGFRCQKSKDFPIIKHRERWRRKTKKNTRKTSDQRCEKEGWESRQDGGSKVK